MNVLFVIKRFSGTIGKDAVRDDFGREMRLAEGIAKRHRVTVIAADHLGREFFSVSMHGMDVHVVPFSFFKIRSFIRSVSFYAKDSDVVVGTTHPVVALLACLSRSGRKFVYDLRDNYETYDLSGVPFLRNGFFARSLLRFVNSLLMGKAALCVCVSHSLEEKIRGLCRSSVVVENGFEPLFRPLSRAKCRVSLKLPKSAVIITYVGHVSVERGCDVLIDAFSIVRQAFPEAILLLSGKVDRGIDIRKPGVVHMALPERGEVVAAINAADVAVLPQPENEVSRYGFAYKLMEYLACGVPVVATSVGDVAVVLRDYPECLAVPGSASDLAERIVFVVKRKKQPDFRRLVLPYSWEQLSGRFSDALGRL